MATPSSDIVGLSAKKLAALIRGRKLSSVEVMSAYLAHIDAINPAVNAIVALRNHDALLAEAAERDAETARGESMGPLHGLPHAVKDLSPTKGIVSTMGSRIFAHNVPAADSLMVERLRNAGAIIIGKTNAPEFGLGSHTYNDVYGTTFNAYDQTRSAGGSSGGAAVALALHMVPLADGSDNGGSLRNPAGWNNVFGFRPGIGVVPMNSRDVWHPSMAVLGPMARNIPDLAMLLAVQAGRYDARSPLSTVGRADQFLDQIDGYVAGKRVAWVGDFGGYLPFEPGVLDTCKQSLKVFESLGCKVEEAQPDYPIEKVWNAWLTLRAYDTGRELNLHYQDPAKRNLMKPEAIFEVKRYLGLKASEVSDAAHVQTEWYNAVQKFFEKHDYFVLPTAQMFPFKASLKWPKSIDGHKMQTYHEWMKCTLPVSLSGCPALAAPAGFSDKGLPIGIQIVGPQRREFSCMQLAHAYDQAAGWSKRLPQLIS